MPSLLACNAIAMLHEAASDILCDIDRIAIETVKRAADVDSTWQAWFETPDADIPARL